jgi:hypothetical protein
MSSPLYPVFLKPQYPIHPSHLPIPPDNTSTSKTRCLNIITYSPEPHVTKTELIATTFPNTPHVKRCRDGEAESPKTFKDGRGNACNILSL